MGWAWERKLGRPELGRAFPTQPEPGAGARESQNSKFAPGLPGYYEDVFNKVGGQSIFHLTVC